jgi:hypothetical protein
MVLLDIVLGSPAANSLLSIVRRKVDEKEEEQSTADATDGTSSSNLTVNRKRRLQSESVKPRIDVDAVVDQAMQKAENIQSLREYLDARKTDSDRISDIRRLQDQQMARLDEKNGPKQ